jgi:predicted dienelactone hydrolase
MRPLEIAYLLSNLPLLACGLLKWGVPGWGKLVSALTLIFMGMGIAVDGARWMMAPSFVVTLWLFFAYTWPRLAQPGRWSCLVLIGVVAVTGAMTVLLPVFELPKPTGSFKIGTVTRHLIDRSRQETQGDRPGGPRELMIQIWYPTDESGPAQRYRRPNEVSLVKQHLALAPTHAASGLPLSTRSTRFPLVMFAPSWTGRRSQNTVQAEELASQGFLVVGIDHPFSTDLTVFPDGRKARTTLGEFLDCNSDEQFAMSMRAIDKELDVRTKDARFVLDELERLNADDPVELLTGRIDFSRVGIFGHSFGGAVAAEMCRSDARCRAGVDYDGFFFGGALEQGTGKPFLCLMDGTAVPTEAELEQYAGRARRELGYVVENVTKVRRVPGNALGFWANIDGTRHMDFCDSPLYTPIKRLSHAGPIDSGRAMQIINAYTVSFFNTYLNGHDDQLLSGPAAQFPEVKIERLGAGRPIFQEVY